MARELTEGGALVAVVGATGAVGREVISVLLGRGVEARRIRALASERSAGSVLRVGAESFEVGIAGPGSFGGVGVAIFAADAETARGLAPAAVEAGATVIDNSSAFRRVEGVPLVVPEVNWGALEGGDSRLVANPNCSTILLVVALEPLRRAFGVEAIDVATYQAVSGAGQGGIDELLEQTRRELGGGGVPERGVVFQEPCAFNVFSHDSGVEGSTGLNGEERKLIEETRKIWGDRSVRVTPTCVRVPVVRAHTQAVTVTLRRGATEAEVRAALGGAPGVRVVDDRAANRFPTPRNASGGDDVLVGRIRPDPSEVGGEGNGVCGGRRWCLMLSGDQLRKGAALNAVQIAEGLGLLGAAGSSGGGALAAGESAGSAGRGAQNRLGGLAKKGEGCGKQGRGQGRGGVGRCTVEI